MPIGLEAVYSQIPVGNEPYTIELEFYMLDTSDSSATFWYINNAATNHQSNGLYLDMSYTTLRHFWYGNDATVSSVAAFSGADGPKNQWFHVAATWNPGVGIPGVGTR